MAGLGLNFEAASRLLKKEFWTNILNGHSGHDGVDGSRRFSYEELKRLYDMLDRSPVVTESNKATVVETIRSIAEFMIWGDQHEPRIFDFFMENNIMVYLHNILQQPQNRTGDVAKQVLQTLSIIVQNIRSETGIFFLFSNNHVNNIVETTFDFEDEEVLGFYITFLKAISLKLNTQTAQFFIIAPEDGDQHQGKAPRLPLYSQAIKLAHHKEGMVRAGVRTLTLGVYSVQDPLLQQIVCAPDAAQYFNDIAQYITKQVQVLGTELLEALASFSQQSLSLLDSQLAELEDMLSYAGDVLASAHPQVSRLLADALWTRLLVPHLLQPLSSAQDSQPTTYEQLCSLAMIVYTLERAVLLLGYPALVNNLALALLGIRHDQKPRANGIAIDSRDSRKDGSKAHTDTTKDHGIHVPSCRQALVQTLQGGHIITRTSVLRLLASVYRCKSLSAGVRVLLGIRGPSAKAHSSVNSADSSEGLQPELEEALACLCALRHGEGSVSDATTGRGQQFIYLQLWNKSVIARANHAQDQRRDDATSKQVPTSILSQQSNHHQAPLILLSEDEGNTNNAGGSNVPPAVQEAVEHVLTSLLEGVEAEVAIEEDESNQAGEKGAALEHVNLPPQPQIVAPTACEKCKATSLQVPTSLGTDLLTAVLGVLHQKGMPQHALWLAGYLVAHLSEQQPQENPSSNPAPQLTPDQRHQVVSALTTAASSLNEDLNGTWVDAFFPVVVLEWQPAGAGLTLPTLAPNADQLVTGAFTQLADETTLKNLGLGSSAQVALQLCLVVQRLVTLLRICQHLGLVSQEGPTSLNWLLADLQKQWLDVVEGQQVALSKANSVPCQVCFVPPDPIRVSLVVAGDAAGVALTSGGSDRPLRSKGILVHSSPSVVLAQTAHNCIDAGVVVSTAPLLGSQFRPDPKVPVWLHVIVRPSVQSLVKQIRKSVGRRGGLALCLRSLSDGHWILQFHEEKRVQAAVGLLDRATNLAGSFYRELIGHFVNGWLDVIVAGQ